MSRAASLAWLASACTYPTLSPALGEGTHVLRKDEVGVTVATGGGGGPHAIAGNDATSLGGGLEGRVRIGLRGDQEIGLSLGAGIATKTTGEPPVIMGATLSYKLAVRPWLAFVGELGIMDKPISSTLIFAGSLAAILAIYDDRDKQVYTGLKGSLAIPRLRDARGDAEVVSTAIGYAKLVNERVRLLAESGIFLGFGRVDSGGTITSANGFGAYGLSAFAYRFD